MMAMSSTNSTMAGSARCVWGSLVCGGRWCETGAQPFQGAGTALTGFHRPAYDGVVESTRSPLPQAPRPSGESGPEQPQPGDGGALQRFVLTRSYSCDFARITQGDGLSSIRTFLQKASTIPDEDARQVRLTRCERRGRSAS